MSDASAWPKNTRAMSDDELLALDARLSGPVSELCNKLCTLFENLGDQLALAETEADRKSILANIRRNIAERRILNCPACIGK